MREDQILLLEMIDSAFDRKGWHGTTLRGAIRKLDAEVAGWRPAPDRHNIWELIVHAAYWKYVVRRRLTGAKRGSFPMTGSDWFESPGRVDAPALAEAVGLLDEQHRLMRSEIASLSELPPSGRKREMLYGIAAHDLYHTGQIQLIRRLFAGA